MINKIPGRRGGPGVVVEEARETDRLTASVEVIDEVLEGVVALQRRLGLQRGVVSGGGVLTLRIDARATALVPLYLRGLRKSPRVAKEAQVTAEELEELQLRARALGLLLQLQEQLHAEVSGSRLIVAAAQGRKWVELVKHVMADLAGVVLAQGERVKLKDGSREILAQAELEEAQRKQRLTELKDARIEAQAKVKEAAARRRRLKALLNLQDQQEIDPAMLDELLRVYEDKVQVPGEEKRRAAR